MRVRTEVTKLLQSQESLVYYLVSTEEVRGVVFDKRGNGFWDLLFLFGKNQRGG